MNQIVCPNCKYLVAYTQFCGNCAARLPQMPYARQEGQQPAGQSQQYQTRTAGIIEAFEKFPTFVKVGLLLLLVFFIVGIGSMFSGNRSSVSTNISTTPSTSTTPSRSAAPMEREAPKNTSKDKLDQAKKSIWPGAGVERLQGVQADLKSIPKEAPEYAEAQKILGTLPGLIKDAERRELNDKRESLKTSYLNLIKNENSIYNFVEAKLTKMKGGYALWAVHEFFNQYSFSAGNDARVVSQWIDENRNDLNKVGIVRVGLMGKGPYASWCYYDLKK